MSQIDPATATLWAALIGVFGALSGLVVERLLRLAGLLRFEASDWKAKARISDGEGSWYLVLLEEADETHSP